MADDLTPEEYLARLNAEAARIASESQRTAPSAAPQPGHTVAPQAAATTAGGTRRGRRVATVVGLVVVALAAVAVAVAVTSSDSDAPVTALSDASGAARDRGEEVLAVADQLDAPPGWTRSGDPELSISGDEDSSYAFADLEWQLPRGSEVGDLHAWFADLPLASDRPDDASCSSTLSGNEGSCEVDLVTLDAAGETDYDAPRQRVTVTFVAADDDATGRDQRDTVHAEVYSTD